VERNFPQPRSFSTNAKDINMVLILGVRIVLESKGGATNMMVLWGEGPGGLKEKISLKRVMLGVNVVDLLKGKRTFVRTCIR
jgi:hypothetical protein